jgi:predicted neuraminidase
MNRERLVSLVLLFLSLAFAFWRMPSSPVAAFDPPSAPASNPLPAEFQTDNLPIIAPTSHASSIAQLPDGRILVAWYAGTREGAGDVQIWFAIRNGSGWSAPRVAATRSETARDLGLYVGKLGNPVVFHDGRLLHLWYVSVSFGGWSGSAINHKTSADEGTTWSAVERLETSPFLNIGTLVRGPPVRLKDGGIGLPIYQELFTQRAEWLRINGDGKLAGKIRLPSAQSALQPAAVALDELRAIALLRHAGPRNGFVMAVSTENGGEDWRELPPLSVGNRNSGLALLRLGDGRLLLAANPQSQRNVLVLLLSNDEGRSWRTARIVADDPILTAEYSYPALLQTTDGYIHLTYSFNRRTIAYAKFSQATLDQGAP